MPLSKPDRDAIGRAVQRLRSLFEEEFTQQATGRFGLHADRSSSLASGNYSVSADDPEAALRPWVEPLEALSLTPTQVVQRAELVGAIAYLHRDGLDGGAAVTRLIREATFTATNQLLAVRVAEASGMLPEITARGRRSSGYRELVVDLFPLLAQDADEGLWTCIQVCGDELGAIVPLLFDRRLPTAAFVPGRVCVDNALAVINAAEVAEVWREPEALGWAYQFFNTKDERDRMREESSAPRDSRELAVRNQFFTPRYVVDWLVQNTLGRRLRQAGYQLDLPFLTGEVDPGPSLALEDVRILDPAVGSGHFLLGCYDLLEQAWGTQDVSPANAAPRILRSLHGVDVDTRASQVTQAVLVLRARRATPTADLDAPNIVTARPLPAASDIRLEVFGSLSPNARDLVEELDDALSQAATLGSLLKVEQRLDSALRNILRNPKLDEHENTTERLERDLADAVDEIAHRADAGPAERLFAVDAHDAVRFVEICQQRYDVVLMNPPFGEPVPETRDYLAAAYGKSAVDMYAAFVHRGLELLNEYGYLGAITSRTGFFLTTFESWRSELVLSRTLALIDLGIGVMHNAMVEAAAYVLTAQPHHGQATFRRLLDHQNKALAVCEGTDQLFIRRPDDFANIPESPAAYWLSLELLRFFETRPALDGAYGVAVRRGTYTGDDFRYIRCWWEAPTSGGLGQSPRWVSFAKGGEYSPYYSHVHLVVDWDYQRGTFTDFYGRKGRPNPLPENRKYFGRPGLTWSRRSQKGFSVRAVPAGAIFSDKGSMIFVPSDAPEDLDRLMAYLNSGLAAALLEAMVAFGSYEVGAVQRLPFVDPGPEAARLARKLTMIRMAAGERSETDHLFVSPWAGGTIVPGSAQKISELVDDEVAREVGTEGSARPLSATYPTRWLEEDADPPGYPTAHQELSYLLGAAFGRWDVRLASRALEPSPLPSPYDPLAAVARGMLVGDNGMPVQNPPAGYPLNVPQSHLLYDEAGHQQDVLTAIDAVIVYLEVTSEPPELALRQEIRDLRRHLRGRFFTDHVRDYSASRRYAPIYWYLAIPSREWGLWVYAPALSREMLFAIAGSARDKLRRLWDQARQLRASDLGMSDRATVEQVEQLENLTAEIEQFAEYADQIAQSGWKPDLNDGLILCAAPLERLFADDAWRKRVSQYRKDLEMNKYPWATVQREFFGSGS